ncbi:MAG: alkaline phosphatase family protein [Bacteroidota bacterium]
MKNFCSTVFLLLLTFWINAQNKAVLILLDGVPADVVERVSTPNLDEIAKAGGYTTAHVGGLKDGYSETPTVSAPGYMNMITGVWAHKHNVRDNAVKNPNYNYWNLFRIVKEVNPELKAAIFSTWEDNRTKLIGEGKESAGYIQLDYSFDGFEKDTSRFPHKSDRKYISDIDELVSNEAARYIEAPGPDFSWVYLEFTDDMGHKYGDSPELDEAMMKADAQVGRIWEAIKKREKMGEEWMIVVTTDHGRSPENGKNHGGQSDRERTTWMFTNQNDLNQSFQRMPGIVDIMPSVLTHMDIEAPENIKAEIDGISFVGDISFNHVTASYDSGKLLVKWNPINKRGMAELWVADTNQFSEGGNDTYQFLATEPVSEGKIILDLESTSGLYKILLKAPLNWGNTWLIK